MLCMHKTTILCQFGLFIGHQLTNLYLHQFSIIFGGNCIKTVHLFLILSYLLGWQSRQLNFVMAYPQAPATIPLYMRLPHGNKHKGITRKTHALKQLLNVYGQKQARRVWNKIMDQHMQEIGFKPSQFDPCLYY